MICLDGRTILRAEFLDLEHAMCDDLCLSFFRDQGAVREGGLCDISIGEVAAGGIGAVFDGSFIRDVHRPRFRGVRARRQLAAVGDGHRTSLCGMAAIFDGSFIRDAHRPLRSVRAGRQLAAVFDGHRTSLCGIGAVLDGSFIRQGDLCACEGAASDGAIIRIIDVEGFSCLVAALRDLAVVGDGGIFCLDGSLIRCRFSEEGDVGVACRLEMDAARHHTAVFGFFAGHFHAEGLSFSLAFDICHVFDGNILTFHIRVGGAHFLICIMAVFG